MIYNRQAETMSRQELEKLQLERLKKVIRYCYDHVKMYHDRFDENHLDPDKFRTLSDLQYIPPTTKDDMRDQYPSAYLPHRRRRLSDSRLFRTTGKPTVVGYTREDLDLWSELMARIISAAGVTDEDIAQVCFGYGLFTRCAGPALWAGARRRHGGSLLQRQQRKAADADEGFWDDDFDRHPDLRPISG